MKRFIALILSMLMLTIPFTASAKGDVDTVASAHIYKNDNTELPYRLILPDNYDDNKSYPMIFFFHGAGERGTDNKLQFFHLVQYIYDNAPEDCIIVAPQCPPNNQWVDTPWANGAYSTEKVKESNEMVAVMELLDDLSVKYNVDSDRIYVIGLSMGGFATWDALMRHNDVFAAGIPICGGGDPTQAEVLKDTPIFTFHAVDDTAVPYLGTKQTVDAIKKVGGDKIEYTQYASGGHGIWNQAIQTKGLLEKLFECKLSDRYPKEESKDESTEAGTSDGTVSEGNTSENASIDEEIGEASKPDTDSEGGFWNATTLTLAISVAIAAVITAILTLVKKKKKA